MDFTITSLLFTYRIPNRIESNLLFSSLLFSYFLFHFFSFFHNFQEDEDKPSYACTNGLADRSRFELLAFVDSSDFAQRLEANELIGACDRQLSTLVVIQSLTQFFFLSFFNLQLDSNANVKLCDFGLSCVKEKRAVVTESVGSPFWMAPGSPFPLRI